MKTAQAFGAVEQIDAAPTSVVLDAWTTTSAAVEAALNDWVKTRGRP